MASLASFLSPKWRNDVCISIRRGKNRKKGYQYDDLGWKPRILSSRFTLVVVAKNEYAAIDSQLYLSSFPWLFVARNSIKVNFTRCSSVRETRQGKVDGIFQKRTYIRLD